MSGPEPQGFKPKALPLLCGSYDSMSADISTILHSDRSTDEGLETLLSSAVVIPDYRWLERGRAYWRDGQAIAVLMQPYTLSTEDLEEILELCSRHRLKVDISMSSEWNPKQTLGILFWRESLNPFIPPHLKPGRAF